MSNSIHLKKMVKSRLSRFDRGFLSGKTISFFIQRSFSVVGLFAILFTAGLNSSRAQNIWTQKADFGGTARYLATGFSIGSKGYIGTGGAYPNYYNDFWEYDPATNAWTQKADFGGTSREAAVGFSIGNKGYIGTGYYNGTNYKDFWEYDPATNVWTQRADFGGTARNDANGFSIGSKGYIGTGYTIINNYKNDFWEYDPATNAWKHKADFGGTGRLTAVGFSMGSKGYIGTGLATEGYKNDFWEYDPATNGWTQKADFGGTARGYAVGFFIGSKGYIGTGYDLNGTDRNDFWEYDPATNAWTQKTSFGGIARYVAVGFSIGSKGYIGTGSNNIYPYYKNDFWEYTPDNSSCALPPNLSVTNITPSSAKLKWDEVSGAEGYKVRYKVTSTSQWTVVNTTGRSKNLNNLTPNTSYTWEIKTYCTVNPGFSSDWSSKQEFTTGSLRMSEGTPMEDYKSLQQISFQVYPNPASDKITVSFQSDEKRKLQILNLLGQIVYSKEINSPSEEIDVSKLPNGIYLITVATPAQKFESKFLKQ